MDDEAPPPTVGDPTSLVAALSLVAAGGGAAASPSFSGVCAANCHFGTAPADPTDPGAGSFTR